MSKPGKKRRVPAGEKNPLRVFCDFVELVAVLRKDEPGNCGALELLLDCCIDSLAEHELDRLGQFGLAMHRKAERRSRQMCKAQIIPFPSRKTLRSRSR